ncbi:MAG: hypothetical protein ACLP1X_07065 [Polyangiaceae bacterium]|jgi:hypothetical protein
MSHRSRVPAPRVAQHRQPTERTRTVRAVLIDDELVIDRCPFCGTTHTHGAADAEIGDLEPRVAHCARGTDRSYVLRVSSAPR